VVIVPFLDRIIGIPLASVQLIAATMSVSGVGLLSLESGSITITAGDLWSLIQPVAYGISFWRTEHALRRYPDEANRLIASQLMACFIISLVTTTVSHETGKDDAWDMRQLAEWLSNPEIVIALLWTGILSTAVTSYLETNAMKHLTATESTLLVSSEPLWASLFAWILVGEKLGVTGVIGGVIIVLSCILSMM
jgi:drug/metabolite transporter (DMT)-like permease